MKMEYITIPDPQKQRAFTEVEKFMMHQSFLLSGDNEEVSNYSGDELATASFEALGFEQCGDALRQFVERLPDMDVFYLTPTEDGRLSVMAGVEGTWIHLAEEV